MKKNPFIAWGLVEEICLDVPATKKSQEAEQEDAWNKLSCGSVCFLANHTASFSQKTQIYS